jgi:hypothetical protein
VASGVGGRTTFSSRCHWTFRLGSVGTGRDGSFG